MGMFDSFLKTALTSVADGSIDKKLIGALDKLESFADKAATTVEKVADAPEKALKVAEANQQKFENKAELLKTHANKTMDVIRRDDAA